MTMFTNFYVTPIQVGVVWKGERIEPVVKLLDHDMIIDNYHVGEEHRAGRLVLMLHPEATHVIVGWDADEWRRNGRVYSREELLSSEANKGKAEPVENNKKPGDGELPPS